MRIRLASNVLQNLAKDFKVQIDEHQNNMDIDIRRVDKVSDADGKEALFIEIFLPSSFTEKAELASSVNTLRLTSTDFPFEFGGKAKLVFLEDIKNCITLDCSIDMEIFAKNLPREIEINQINASSVLHIPQNAQVVTKIKGKSNRIRFSDNNSDANQAESEAASRIEVAGMNAELLIVKDIKDVKEAI